MREGLIALFGMAAGGLISAAVLFGRGEEKKCPAPGRDIRLPEEETAEERRMREWLMLLGYSGEKGGAR